MAEGNGIFTLAAPRDIENLEDCHFYHTLDLPGFGTVEGEWDLRGRFDDYVDGIDLRGKTVLDVGTANGFLTFEAEKRGAKQVVSFDIGDAKYQHLLPFKDGLYYQDYEAWRANQSAGYERWKNGYWLAHRLYDSKARAFYGNIYDLPTAAGTFDVAIIGSVLEHLSDQVSALASVARLTKSKLVVVTGLLETEDRLAYFIPLADQPKLDYTWWAYSLGTYREVFAMLGFGIDSVKKNSYRVPIFGRECERYTIVASRQ
jgi:SAM-dependent methyltransferase